MKSFFLVFRTELFFVQATLAMSAALLPVKAQNLVVNGSLESPDNSLLSRFFTRSFSPENNFYFTSNGKNIPLAEANLQPHSGKSAGAFISYNKNSPDHREYFSFNLAKPLTPDSEYQVTFWLCYGKNSKATFLSNNIGVLFSTDSFHMEEGFPLKHGPLLELTSIITDSTWQWFTFRFTADSAYRFISLGNFRPDNETLKKDISRSEKIARYFIDDVSLMSHHGRKTSIPFSENSVKTFWKIYPSPGDGNETLLVEDKQGAYTVFIYDNGGRMVYSTNIAVAEGQATVHLYLTFLSPGIYFARLTGMKEDSVQKFEIKK